MSDPLDVTVLASHGIPAVASAGGVAAFMRWLAGKEAQEVSTKLALMAQKLDQLVESATKHEKNGERIALLEQSVRNLNDRVDALVTPPPLIPERRRR